MTDKPKTTEGIFTTQKLQALFDCRRNPQAYSRQTLAEAMTAAGQKISVHGIDAWFRPVDSNYGLERDSLEKGRRSFQLPKRRWALLLQIYDLDEAELEYPDAEFRRRCFDRMRRKSGAAESRPASRQILLVSHASTASAESLAAALAAADCSVTRLTPDAPDADSTMATRLRSAAEVVVCAPSGEAPSELLHRALEQARDLGVPALWLRSDDAAARAPEVAGVETVGPGPGVEQLVELVVRRARRPAVQGSATTSWSPPEPVTDRPSIAVLPFVSLTRDDDGAMLAASLTEDVTTLLSRIPEFFVIAHSTMRTFRERHPEHATLRRQLGVRYLLEGSIRSDGTTLRVTAELIDAQTGASLWSQRFDRPLTDLFSVQDEITVALCAQLEPRVRVADIDYGARTGSVTSWRLWQEGWHWLFVDAPQPVPERSLERFRKAIELEPGYALGHAGLAIALSTGLLWGGLGQDALDEARLHAQTALELLPENPVALYAMAMITFVQPAAGLAEPLSYIERAVELEPSNAMYQGVYGYLLANSGRAQDGVDTCLHAMRLSPRDSREPFLCYMLGAAYIANAQYELAIETMTRCRRFSEVDFIWLMVGFAHAQLGEQDRAISALRRIRDARPYWFYRFALLESFWLDLPRADKEAFLPLLEAAGIE